MSGNLFQDLGPHDPFEAEGKATSVEVEDSLRLIVTILFSGAFVILLFVYLYLPVKIEGNGTWTQTKDAFGVILPAITGILGTVIGFYFGNREKKQ